MRILLCKFWREEEAAILSAEVLLIATILVIGMIVGLKSVRDSVVTELADVAEAFDNANPRLPWGPGGEWGGQGKWGGDWGGGHGGCIDTCAAAGSERW